MKKIIAILIAISLLCGLLAGCTGGNGNESISNTSDNSTSGTAVSSTTPDDDSTIHIWDGYYYLNVSDRDCYIHFSEDGTYYASYFGGSVEDAGTWELVDEPTEYIVDTDNSGMGVVEEGDELANSEQTIIMTSYTAGTPVRAAYVDDTLMDVSLGGLANHRYLPHVPDYKYDATKEVAIQLYVYYANNNIGATFVLNHNKTFEDATGDSFDTGTWEMTGTGEYALIYDWDDSTATLKTDGKTATLTKADGSVTELKDDYKEEDSSAVQIMLLYAKNVDLGLGIDVTLFLKAYKDGKCELIADVGSHGSQTIDQGTYEVSKSMVPTFHFDGAGDIVGAPNYETATSDSIDITIQYVGSTSIGTIDQTLSGLYKPNATVDTGFEMDAAPAVVTAIKNDEAQVGLPMPVQLRIDCYDDGTAKVILYIAQKDTEYEIDDGTYEVTAAMKYNFVFASAGEIVGEPDYATADSTAGTIVINVHYIGSAEISGTTLSVDCDLSGTHTAG